MGKKKFCACSSCGDGCNCAIAGTVMVGLLGLLVGGYFAIKSERGQELQREALLKLKKSSK